ncbi:MAG: GvpL/GvpF family gas vesicle protein [Thermoanaerobaculia bacterium]
MTLAAPTRLVLLGAHLRAEDAAVEGVRVVPAGDLFLSALEIPSSQGVAAHEVVTRAASVRQELALRETFIAIRYGATATTDQEAAAKCSTHLPRWRQLLGELRGMAELTMRAGGGAKGTRPDRAAFASGADYLRALRASKTASPVDPAFLEDARSRFAEAAGRIVAVERHDGGAELAMLVARDRIEEARNIALALRDDWPHIPFLLSGPWPLEVFADES